MGQKNFKGAVTITNDNSRIRLRWRYLSKRYSLSLSQYTKSNLLHAKKVASQIEQDMVSSSFDYTLKRYKQTELNEDTKASKSVLEYFEEWTSNYRQMDCDVHINYYSVRGMMRKWGDIKQDNILKKLNAETFSAGIYNRRLTMLKAFCK